MGKGNRLKGFSGLGVFLVENNTSTAYSVTGPRTELEGAYSCGVTDNVTTTPIPADDDPNWDIEKDWESTDLEIVVRQAELKVLAKLIGTDFSETSGILEEGLMDNAPIVAFTFKCLRKDGGYRLYRYYNCKLTGYSVSHKTRGDGAESQDYTLSFKCSARQIDDKVRASCDIGKDDSPSEWLEDIPSLPVTP